MFLINPYILQASGNPLWNGLQAYYTADNTPNDALGTYNGTLTNGTTYSTGIISNGFSFDGVNDYVDISPSFGDSFSSPTSTYTYSAWVYPTSVTGFNFVINNGTSVIGSSMILNGDKIAFFYRGGTNQVSSDVTVPINTWSLITVVYNGAGSVSFYLNGTFDVTKTASWTEATGTTTTNIGSYVKANHFFDGIIDEVGIWNRELSASEVTELYNSGAGKQYPTGINVLWNDLLAYYTADNTPNDALGTYDLTLYNGTTYTTGVINNGFSFDGVNDYAETTATRIGHGNSDSFTISCWINGTILNRGLVVDGDTGDGATLGTWNSGAGRKISLLKGQGASQCFGNTTLSSSTLYHLVAVHTPYNGVSANVQFYLDGSADGSAIFDIGTPTVATVKQIGTKSDGSTFYTGMIDEVGIWSRDLSASEVTELYNAGAGKQYPN